MAYKKYLFFILSCLLLLFFGEKTLLGCIGNITKLYFHFSNGWVCSYESIAWENRQIIVSGLSLKKDSFFSFFSPKARISITKKHIEIERPHVVIEEIPKFSNRKVSSWTCQIEDGILEGLLPQSRFSFESNEKNQGGNLHIQWKYSSLSLNLIPQEGNTLLSMKLDKVPLAHFHEWIGDAWEGIIDGSFELLKDKDTWKAVKGQIDAIDISYQEICENIHGKLDWEGSFSKTHIDAVSLWMQNPRHFSSHLEEIWNEGRLRFFISQGKVLTFDQVELLFSFDGKSGAKWEVSSLFEDRKITAIGRGLLQGIQGNWLESEVSSLHSTMILRGLEKDDSFLWELTAKSLDVAFVKMLQKIAGFAGKDTSQWSCLEGLLDGSIQVFQEENGHWNWKVLDVKLQNINVQKDTYSFSCKEAYLKDDIYSFSDGNFKMGEFWIGSEWSGEGNLASGFSVFSGQIGTHLVGCIGHGNFDAFDILFKIEGDFKGEMSLSGKRVEDAIHFSINKSFGSLFSLLKLESLEMQGELHSDRVCCYQVKGICDIGKKLCFFAPRIETKGIFDIRFETDTFEVARLVGTSRLGKISTDTDRSHFFNHPISLATALFSAQGIESLNMEFPIFEEACEFFLKSMPSFYEHLHSPFLHCSIAYEALEGIQIKSFGHVQHGEKNIDLRLDLIQKKGGWSLEPLQISDCIIFAEIEKDKDGFWSLQGKGKFSDWMETNLNGKLQDQGEGWVNLSQIRIDLSGLHPLHQGLEGILSGEGLVQWKGKWESDFDFSASPLQIGPWKIENQEPLHLFFSSEKGISIKGVNASISHMSNPSLQNKCKASLVQYDFYSSFFVFTQSRLYLTEDACSRILALLDLPFSQEHLALQSVQLDADIAFSSQLSHLSLSMKEAQIPAFHKAHHVQNVHLDKDLNEWRINFDLEHLGSWIPIELDLHTEPHLKGRLIIENGMAVDWEYQDRLVIHSIGGAALGFDASFHGEENSLVGSAKIDCHRLKKIVPSDIAQVFYELKMGDGYELMGKIHLEKEGIFFKGLLIGKEFELFGFRLRNLMSQIELAKDHVAISDVKISDFSGSMKIDAINAQGVSNKPWTISIPHITVTELRPSLLQEVDKPLGELTPLVIRELKIDDIQGVLEDSKSYTGKGELYFINSYKRGKSILEVPSDILSRIVGLDLDLLVPVCGTLRYELHDGFFHFTELTGSFSENKRSEFFLVFNENSPKMDLDWNLNILIKMNQFVLFKITESFFISVKGKLDSPKFQLQRKKSFL